MLETVQNGTLRPLRLKEDLTAKSTEENVQFLPVYVTMQVSELTEFCQWHSIHGTEGSKFRPLHL